MKSELTEYIKLLPDALNDEEKERELLIRISKGDLEARTEFIERNLRLVPYFAKTYFRNNVSSMDIVAQGNIGLIKAVDGYDMNRNIKFSVYAKTIIRREIQAFLAENEMVCSIPYNLYGSRTQIESYIMKYKKIYGCNPTNKDISDSLGIPEEEVRKLRDLNLYSYSLNHIVFDNSIDEFDAYIEDESQELLLESVLDEIYNNHLDKVLSNVKLTENERKYLEYYLSDEERIAKQFNFSKQRVAQIKAKLTYKLQTSKAMIKFLNDRIIGYQERNVAIGKKIRQYESPICLPSIPKESGYKLSLYKAKTMK